MYNPKYPAPVKAYSIKELSDILKWPEWSLISFLQQHVDKIGVPLEEAGKKYHKKQIKIIFDMLQPD
ncbi:hypothetical protein [Chitinophaga sp.]|uniref:hypothetical protein n=1 Tax=Chitinophaga sp. TaxID=1869181 RepID=UPI0031DFB662